MWKRRLLWLIWVLGAAALYIFVNNPGTLAILIASALTPVAAMLLTGIAAKRISVKLTLPERCEANQPAQCALIAEHRGRTPLAHVACRLCCHNQLTDARTETLLPFSVLPQKNQTMLFSLESACCGSIRLEAAEIRISDPFGLIELSLPCSAGQTTLVLPDQFPTQTELVEQAAALLDSDQYSPTEPGGDPSETFGIREYVPGDSIKSIHWKLSEKAGRTMVRQLGLPVVSQTLLLLESSFPEACEAPAPQTIHALLSAFVSISHALAAQGLEHAAGWQDMATGSYESILIRNDADLDAALERVLSNPIKPAVTSVARCFLNANGRCAYTHVVVISACQEPELDALYSGNRISLLLCAPAEAGIHPNGITVIPFSETTYRHDLSRLEL